MLSSRKILFDQLTPITIFAKLQRYFEGELCFLFESAINNNDGNFSFLFIGARERVIHQDDVSIHIDEEGVSYNLGSNPFTFLKKRYAELDKTLYQTYTKELGVGFVDGFIGYIGYDAVKIFEPRLRSHMDGLKDELHIPEVDLMRPKLVCTFSHKTNTLILTTFVPSIAEQLDLIEATLKEPHIHIPIQTALVDKSKSSFALSKERFFDMVAQAKEMIRSGDVFQILMSNRFTQYAHIDRLSFYRILRQKNPSPYMFYLSYPNFAIIGSSPEVMVGLKDGRITLRPIAGTRKRGSTYEKDIAYEKEMLSDEKERAEHLMLIDLGRNDLGRVAKVGSVKVKEMMRVERYSHVMHMVTDIEAILDVKYDMFDLFAATFTAGTMTGTPKIRAMELISDFEGLKRSFYSGAAGYFGFDGNMDSCIMIRTAYLDDEKIIFQAGGGIVADSKPELEYLEVTNKLGAMTSSLDDLRE
ncbi:anthranilate synthase component I family protein [Sulfurospirillum diekertiae]|uniref:Anthranilate synthase component 1 n=1 Tax=Sulfurospirillum diekertiae TaxID=1854492 RepID=A0A6G9VUN4_9BACT|nr:anthranilate synthase component I family protein [Sulfurospirillum diekertiae]QIR76628.1 anthranilate synthase component I family protein [Sulfurospirillum diekertiae]QIR79257.1 anthranilate synthase component I family protein [Sulfurospirillum diekertiae]